MKENEMIEEGFERVDVSPEESGDDKGYFYYKYNLTDTVALISEDSDSVNNDNWKVNCYEMEVYGIRDIEDVQLLIALFKKWSKIK